MNRGNVLLVMSLFKLVYHRRTTYRSKNIVFSLNAHQSSCVCPRDGKPDTASERAHTNEVVAAAFLLLMREFVS